MIFLINSSYTIWIPIYSLSDYKYQSVIYKSLIVIECLLSLLALSFTIITVFIVFSSRAFHRNLNSLIAVIILSWLLSLVSRTLLTPYLIGWTPVTSGDVNSGWWTDDVAGMTQLEGANGLRSLWIGGFLGWYYICIMDSCMFFIALERSAASYFIRDYEKTSHHHVLFFFLVSQQAMALVMTYLCFWNLVHFAFAIGFSILINLSAVLIFYANRQYNMNILRKFEEIKFNPMRNMESYSLPARFQAKENVRSFDLTFRFLICGFVMIFTAITLVLMLNYNWFPSLETFLVYCMENCIHLNPLIVCPVGMLSVSTWSKALLKSKAIWIQKIANIDSTSQNSPKQSQQHETDTYFFQLKNSWELRRK